MKKRLKSLLTALLLALSVMAGLGTFSGIARADEIRGIERTEIHISEDEVTAWENSYSRRLLFSVYGENEEWTKYSSDYFYNLMTENERKLYDRIEAICLNFILGTENALDVDSGRHRTVLAPYADLNLSEDEAKEVAWKFFFEEPQYYFLNSVVYAQSGSEPAVGFGVYSDFADGETRKEKTQELKSIFDVWEEQINSYTGEADRQKAAHDITCENLVYELNNFDQSIAGGIFNDGKSVCAGYSKTYMMLCNASGVETINITGTGHAWNMSRVNGVWYIVDCTWDDQATGIIYKYFNLTDAQLEALDYQGMHLAESRWSGRPVCDGTVVEQPGTKPGTDPGTEKTYSIDYELNGGVNSADNPAGYKETDEISLKAPTRKGYWFQGWYTKEGVKITSIKGGDKKEYILSAKWKKASVKKVTVKKYVKKSKTISYKIITDAVGYEIIYSTKKNFAKKASTVISTKKLSARLGKVKAGKKYYVKIRAYTFDSTGKKIYGKYSKVYVIS